ncbi:MAG: DUF1150 family protein [Acetobacteraceae bacterium]|jgi:hypothetical protein
MSNDTEVEVGETEDGKIDVRAFDVRHMTADQLGALGVSHIAYVKPVIVNGEMGFAIHAADGTPMALAEDRATAMAAIMQHEMLPLSVH